MTAVVNANNRDYLKQFPDGFFDLVIDDPPYGIGESSKDHNSRNTPVLQSNGARLGIANKNYHRSNWDDAPPDQVYFDELFRVSKRRIIWGENHLSFSQKSLSSGRIVWDKLTGNNDFSDCEIAWTDLFSSVRQFRFMWSGMMQGISVSEGWKQQGNKKLNEKRMHCTQKPVALYIWCLKRFAKEGWIVGDFHVGSGSSRIAADQLGFEFYGCEIDAVHFRDQEERFGLYQTTKPKLFT